ncbi:Tannase/feruloyl esterase [Bisporella sp. PMI_857]|nr:Tannase/feruloyl esterase [Bisporella sp. PMI_857]
MVLKELVLVLCLPLFVSSASFSTQKICSPSSFAFPEIFGTTSLGISANYLYNFTAFSLSPGSNDSGVFTIDFCNVTITYTHFGWNDTINVNVWLPLSSWNGRLQALGGGGYSAGFGSLYSTQAVSKGYVAIDTDAGHVPGALSAQSPEDWALDWGSRSLHEMAVIGKTVTESYYGTKPLYSYFSGCSGGGRQGLMIAERYAEDFDGILAVAPAINIEKFIPAGYWATFVMNKLGVYPQPCEIEAFTQAAIDACDSLDGVEDRIISLPRLCNFDPHSIVNKDFSCNGTIRKYSEAGASIVQAAWTGSQSTDARVGWSGLSKDASLTSIYIPTQCSTNGTCWAAPSSLLESWLKYLVVKDPGWDGRTLTEKEFFTYLRQSEQEYGSMLSAADPDLSQFRDTGGKIIVWHGLADEAIPPNGTVDFYQRVLKIDPAADRFFRFYEAPGVGHCFGGIGPIPSGAFDQLIHWVEEGLVPETLTATGATGYTRKLCSYPLQQVYLGGDPTAVASFGCSLTENLTTNVHGPRRNAN